MSADSLRRYRFATEAQWNACLMAQANREALRANGGLLPFAPYARPGTLFESPGAHAPVVTQAGEILWRDDNGCVHRLTACHELPETHAAPGAIARATRIVSAANSLWTAPFKESIQGFEPESLTRVLTIDVPDTPITDIASDGRDAVLALVKTEERWESVGVYPTGPSVRVPFEGISEAQAFVFLRRSKRFVVLAGYHPRLYWFAEKGGRALFSMAVAGMRPCFEASVLGSDSRDRVFLGGTDSSEFGGRTYVLIFDADGNSLGDVPIDANDGAITGIAATPDLLLVTGQRGLLQFKAAEVVPDGAGSVRCVLITPMLHSPDREDQRRWLRAEASADLPEGTTLDISVASTGDAEIRDRVNAILSNTSVSESSRIAQVQLEPGIWRGRIAFHGSAAAAAIAKAPLAAKLFDVRDPYLWVCLTLQATTGARLPKLSQLEVLYPGRTLMESLPAIYQAEEERPNSFLRGLVGVLETTTQGLDTRIASMASQIHPSTAPAPWLDFIARWLGVPWDDGMKLEQKQRIVAKAAELANGRGTRAGLEALLEALLPGSPKRYRVTDATADFGFAIVGGEACEGSTLPAMLGGRTRWSAELNARAVLGVMRLPCEGQVDDGVRHLTGHIRIEVAATAAERQAWKPWLRTAITDMVPLTAQVELRWVSSHDFRTDRLDGTLTLESPPLAHLGTDAQTGAARLAEGRDRLSASGSRISTRLR